MKYAVIGLALLVGTIGAGYCQTRTPDQPDRSWRSQERTQFCPWNWTQRARMGLCPADWISR